MSFSLLENYRDYREHFEDDSFTSPDSIILLIKTGSLLVTYKDEQYRIENNQAVLFKKNAAYRRVILDPVTFYLFRYKSEYPIFLETKITFSDIDRIQSTFALLDILDENISASNFTYRKSIFSDIITQYSIERCLSTSNSVLQEPLIAETISYLQSHIRSQWDIADISSKYSLTPTQLSNRFRLATNMTPSKYMTYLKIQRAKDLLADSNLRIKEIASECGFANEYYFSSFFKKHASVSPVNYRKEILESADQQKVL